MPEAGLVWKNWIPDLVRNDGYEVLPTASSVPVVNAYYFTTGPLLKPLTAVNHLK
jgi:hypothetical protein